MLSHKLLKVCYLTGCGIDVPGMQMKHIEKVSKIKRSERKWRMSENEEEEEAQEEK